MKPHNCTRTRQKALRTTTVRLAVRQDAWLTAVTARIRLRTGAVVDRSAIIRAAIDAMRTSIDLTHCGSELEIRGAIVRAIGQVAINNRSFLDGGRRRHAHPAGINAGPVDDAIKTE